MSIKKLDFKFVNELRRNQHIKEIADAINSNANELSYVHHDLYSGYSGDNSSTKKIYCHPIFCSDGGVTVNLQMLLFDNNPTAYTKTTLIAKLKELMDLGAVIQANGWYKDSNNKFNSFYNMRYITNSYRIFFFNVDDGYTNDYFDTIFSTITTVVDGVNAIN